MPTDVIIDPSTGQIYWNDNTGSPQSISIKGDALNAISVTGYSASFSPGSSVGGTTTLVTFNDNSGTAALVPGTSGFDLGSSSLRWNTFATNANLSGTLVVSDSTISSNLLTGSIRFNGGIAISGNASIGQSLNFYNTAATFYTGFRAGTLSTNTLYTLPTAFPGSGTSVLQSDTSGNLTWIGVSGSAATSQNVAVNNAGNASAFHPILFTPSSASSGSAVSSDATISFNPSTEILNVSGLAVTSGAISTSTTSGAFQVKGGIGITGNAFIGGTINLGSPLSISNGGTNVSSFGQTGGFIYYDGANVRLLAATGASINFTNGYYQFDNRVYATSFFANNSQMPNGSGTAGRVTIWSGNNTIGSDAEFTYDATNNILNVTGNINAIGFTASGIAITSVTASTSTTTGALVVAGGVGISGRLTFNQASFGTTGISSLPTMAMIGQTGDPIFMSVLEDNSIAFEGSQGQLFSISPNLTTGYIWAVNDISGVPLLRANVNGNVYITEFGGNLGIGQTNPTYKLDLKGSFGLASSNDSLYNFIFSNSAVSGSNSLQIRSANSILLYNSGNTFYTGFKSNASDNVTYTLPPDDGGSGQFLQTNGSGILSWATATGGAGGGSTGVGAGAQYDVAVYPGTGASVLGYSSLKNDFSAGVVSVSHSTVATNFSNGAFTVSGGVGIGGSLFVGGIGASIVGVTISNSTITRGTWNGTVIGVQYGGTGQNLTGLSGLLSISSGTVSATTTPNIYSATGTSLYLSATSPSNTTTSGALIVPGGVGIGLSVSIGGRLQLFNGSNYAAFLFAGTSNTTYTLPSTSPATGSSVLQSDSTGAMSWVPMVASGGAGSGTVAIPDAQYRLAYYAGTGASVSSTNLITAVGTGVTILGATNASSTTVAALSILGGLGVTGNAFIGGTTNITSSQTSTSTSSGALVVTGGVGIGGSLFTGTSVASSVSGVVLSNGLVTSGTWSGTVITALYGGTGFNSYSVGDLLVASTGTSLAKLAASSNSGYVLTSTGANSVPTWQAVPPAAATSVAVAPTVVNGQFSITTVNSSSGTGLGLSTIASFVINPSTGLVTLSGLAVTNGANSSSTTTGTLTVYGGLGITGNAFIGGTTNITSSQTSTSTSSGALVVTGGVGIGGSLFTPTSNASSISGVVLSNNAVTASTLNKVTVTAPASSATLTVADGSSLITSGAFSLTLTTTATTNATFPSGNSTLVATNVSSLSSLSTIGTITSGTWAGTVITSLYGGTGFNSYSVGDLLVASTGTSLAKLAASSNTGYVLTSTGANSVPTWQAVPSSSATSVAVIPTTVNGQFSITAVSTSSGTGLGLSTIASFVINPSTGLVTLSGLAVTNGTNSSSTTTGALTVYGGLGITGNAFIGGTTNITSSQTSTSTSSGALVVTGGVGIGGSLYTATSVASSLSGVIASNGAVTASSYNKVAITAPASSATLTLSNGSSLITSGGHSLTFTTSNTTSVTLPTTGTLATTSNKLSDFAATTSLELLNTITGETGSGALVFGTSPEFTTSITTPSTTFSVFNATATTINAFGAATILSIGANSGKATFNSTDESSSATTGSLVVSGGAGVAKTLSIGGSLNIFSASSNYSGFRYSGTANTTYTLPTNTPQSSVGTSVLTSTTAGVMSWVGMAAGGSGSPGGSNKQIQYNNSSAFGGASGFEYTSGGIAVTVSIFSPSGTGYTSGLWVSAIGGTTRVGIGLSNPQYELEILGEISATNKSFVIDHPTKSGMKLRYGSLEGPENGVYVRGELKNSNIIEVPDHWLGLVHPDSYTVHLTPIGRYAQLYVEKIENYNVYVADTNMDPIHCYYSVWAERKDIPKLITEYEAQ